MFSKDNIMVFPHSACIKIEQTFDEIEKIVKVLEEKIEKECKGSPLLFQNSESSGGEKVVLLEDPEELLTKIKKSVEWMKGAKEDVSGMRTMVFENKFSEKKDKISIVTDRKDFATKTVRSRRKQKDDDNRRSQRNERRYDKSRN